MEKTNQTKELFKTFQEQYYDGEVDYSDERCVSSEMKQGQYDCVKYLDSQKIDDEVLWRKYHANSGKFYREPHKSEFGLEVLNTYSK
ncbi:hypothetical protein [Paenibacillus sp. FSL H3-0286]|uniref:hypothetical protein n=1 Tax=Paenibacillus sp. FSL H3-0286 TaxID=2921427 RepID=UPI00324FDAA5